MSGQTVSELWSEVFALQSEIEEFCVDLLQTKQVFEPMSLRPPRHSPPELGFFQAVSWLYAFYIDVGGTSFRFLIEKFSVFHLDAQGGKKCHYEVVRSLRTYLQHNLNLESKHDRQVQRACEDWFLERCGSVFPESDTEWNDLLYGVLCDSVQFLETALICIREINRDESREFIIGQWTLRLNRFHPKHEFQAIVEKVIHDFGQPWLDAYQIADRNYDKWCRALKYGAEDYVFELEARKLVEQTLLSDFESLLPITGEDIMREFGIPPSREVGRQLTKARAIYIQCPMPSDALIARLRESLT